MDEDLKTLAELALSKARLQLTQRGSLTPGFMVRDPGGTMRVIELGGRSAELLNSGKAKDVIFGAMREMVKAKRLTAVVFISEGWMGKQTPKGAALPPGEFLRRTRERAFATALKDGLIERFEVVTVTVQTPARTCIVHQEFIRDDDARTVVFGERTECEVPVDEFTGRQKMYGDLRKENLG